MNKQRWIYYGFSLFVSILIGSLGIFFYGRMEKEFSGPVLRHHAEVNFGFLRAMTVDALITEDRATLENFLEQARDNHWDVKKITFESREGEELAEWKDENWPRIEKALTHDNSGEGGYYEISENVDVKGENFGKISVVFDFRKIITDSVLHERRIKMIGICFFTMLGILTLMPLFFLDVQELATHLIGQLQARFGRKKAES